MTGSKVKKDSGYRVFLQGVTESLQKNYGTIYCDYLVLFVFLAVVVLNYFVMCGCVYVWIL